MLECVTKYPSELCYDEEKYIRDKIAKKYEGSRIEVNTPVGLLIF